MKSFVSVWVFAETSLPTYPSSFLMCTRASNEFVAFALLGQYIYIFSLLHPPPPPLGSILPQKLNGSPFTCVFAYCRLPKALGHQGIESLVRILNRILCFLKLVLDVWESVVTLLRLHLFTYTFIVIYLFNLLIYLNLKAILSQCELWNIDEIIILLVVTLDVKLDKALSLTDKQQLQENHLLLLTKIKIICKCKKML